MLFISRDLVISSSVDCGVDVVVDANHVDVPDVHVYNEHDLVSPDSDRLHLPVVSEAQRIAGWYMIALKQLIRNHVITCQLHLKMYKSIHSLFHHPTDFMAF